MGGALKRRLAVQPGWGRGALADRSGNFKNGSPSYLVLICENGVKDMQKLHGIMPCSVRCRAVARVRAMAVALLTMGLLWGVGAWAQGAGTVPVRILAASDLKFALANIADKYQADTGQRIEVAYGSSGNMARQLLQGLPADIYMAADEALVFKLAQAGVTRSIPGSASGASDTGMRYAQGRLALVVPQASTLPLDIELTALQKGWPAHAKFAIANPEHAPYGLAAQQALQTLGLWSAVQPHLVLGENMAQATQYVSTGAAAMGITALSLAQAPELKGQLRYLPLPTHMHAPLNQRMVLLKGASPQALAFYKYLQQPAARKVLLQYGFGAPP